MVEGVQNTSSFLPLLGTREGVQGLRPQPRQQPAERVNAEGRGRPTAPQRTAGEGQAHRVVEAAQRETPSFETLAVRGPQEGVRFRPFPQLGVIQNLVVDRRDEQVLLEVPSNERLEFAFNFRQVVGRMVDRQA